MAEAGVERERVILAGADPGDDREFEYSIKELRGLADACEMETVGVLTQKMDKPDKALCIGRGKAEELREFAEHMEADMIIFDNALTPSQLRNLQQIIGKPVMDRTALILEIFSARAGTREARLQVESARLQYLLPRLVGMHAALSRQGGGSGLANKGAGEKKLEQTQNRGQTGKTAQGIRRRESGAPDSAQKAAGILSSSGGAGRLYQCGKIHPDERLAGTLRAGGRQRGFGGGQAVCHAGHHSA